MKREGNKENLASILEGISFLAVLALNDSFQFLKRKYYQMKNIPYEQSEHPPLTYRRK